MKLAKTKRILKMILCILILILLFFIRRSGLGYGLHFLFVNVITFNKKAFVFQHAHNESLEEVSSIIKFLILK
jgi:hypothetical protein